MLLKENSFTEYEMDDEELISSAVFNDLQLAGLKSERSRIAQLKLALSPDPTVPTKFFLLEHEYLRGQLEMMDYLLTKHEACISRQKDLMQQYSDGQREESSVFDLASYDPSRDNTN